MYSMPRAAKILSIEEENYRTKTIVLDLAIDAYPGQFVMVWLPRFDEKPFSLVNADPVTLMVTEVGPFSELVHDRSVGDLLWIRGPYGNGFRVPASQKRLALIGGGYGVAPLYWLAREQEGAAAAVTNIVGARSSADLLYNDRLSRLKSSRTHYRLLTATEDGSSGEQGRVTDLLAPLLSAGEIDGIYACGPHGMLDALVKLADAEDVPAQLSWEAYMRCGIGVCGACEHAGHVLCLDGPVLQHGNV